MKTSLFYLPDAAEWESACARMRSAGFAEVPSRNPYWDRQGCSFEDLDGYRVVLQRAAWPAGQLVTQAPATQTSSAVQNTGRPERVPQPE